MIRTPAATLKELDDLDTNEVIEGYRDGFANEPCGGNRSPSYWHGWRNGQVDGSHALGDDAQRNLAREYVRSTMTPAELALRVRNGERFRILKDKECDNV